QTIRIDQLGGDINNQFGYNHDYSAARVDFNYDSPAAGKLSGKITAAVLKPYATYQLKFEGKPSCQYGTGGNDLANEYIGYRGRWWDRTINANVNDAQYAANSVYKGGTHCIVGYLVWDHFTADAAGVAVKDVQTLSSYHVLWCSGGACGAASNTKLANLDASHPALKFCAPEDVNGQLERGGCGNLVLESGNYDLKMILTEESFHNGNWASVLQKDISFTIE
ncbi:MAG: hypothetical protein MUD10_04565, partial [Candidatus Pacebacteria bacterium]|nr:hypothetical protein [Candidatus Paceibacterota bacterium]